MNINIGRNDPCHCGSGKKYKKCCLALTSSSNTVEVVDFAWRRLRKLEGAVFDQHLIPYVTKELPSDIMKWGLADCIPDELPETLDEDLLLHNFFLPWLLFNWISGDHSEYEQFDPTITISQNYIKTHGNKLNSRERGFIDVMNQTYYSFYSILQVDKDRSLRIKDIMLGTTHTIKEKQGTHQLKQGDIVYGRVLTMDNQSIFVGMAPFIVPTDYHNNIIDFREWLIEENDIQTLTPEILHEELDLDLLDHFFEIMEDRCNKPLPTLVNTDGEPFQFSKSYFKLNMSPEEALNHLLPLTLSDDPEGFLQEAKRTASGEIECIEFPWLKEGNEQHKSWDNTVLGHISIDKDQLILETNSDKRTQNGKKLLSEYLGESIKFQQTLIETPEQKMQSLPTSNDDSREEMEDLMQSPEVQKQLVGMAKAHWNSWFDEPIPALKDQTPREATKTDAGRERLEALLLQYERHDLERGEHPFKADIAYLRSELALE